MILLVFGSFSVRFSISSWILGIVSKIEVVEERPDFVVLFFPCRTRIVFLAIAIQVKPKSLKEAFFLGFVGDLLVHVLNELLLLVKVERGDSKSSKGKSTDEDTISSRSWRSQVGDRRRRRFWIEAFCLLRMFANCRMVRRAKTNLLNQ